ncbi:MAG: acylneuraminate cytidylyltransferase [Gemmatimonadetes bacterium]|nr:acylneuraminate cytidylyltransferase [Gemmatimonadota bacterium]
MNRSLVAALACRNQGSRLYGKPLQNLDVERGVRILDNIVACLRSLTCIDEVVLGISEGRDNEVFMDIAQDLGVPWIVGDQTDVLQRLIQCAEAGGATDVFRVTSESPFLYFEPVEEMWRRHRDERADATFLWDIIDGAGCEIYTLEALRRSWDRGSARHRSELCSLYVRENPDEFSVLRIDAPPELRRKDMRLTVDYPEDLVVCRAAYMAFREHAPRIPVEDVVRFLDEHPQLLELVAPYTEAGYATMDLWGRTI